MSTKARTAKRKRIASFARERFTSQGTAASSFVFEMATWYVRSPTLVPAVARRCSQRRRLEDYESNTRSLMGKLVQQPSGYRSDLQGPYRSTVRHAANTHQAKHFASLWRWLDEPYGPLVDLETAHWFADRRPWQHLRTS